MSNLGNENFIAFPNPLLEDMSHKHITEFSHPVEWLDALRTDNVKKATMILQSATKDYKDFLLNGDIPAAGDIHHKPLNRRSSRRCSNMALYITKPLHAAAVFQSHAVMRLLLDSGVDVLQQDRWKNNVVHRLIFAASTEKNHATKHAKTLVCLQALLSEKELKSLLRAENGFTLRPLEFAALHSCTDMMTIIMQTKGVYLIKEEHIGYNVVQYFDVSDYELFDDGVPPRLNTSPLLLLIFGETSHIQGIGSDNIFREPGLKSWIHSKIMINWPFVFIWFLLRLFYIGLFFSASLDNSWPTVVINGSDLKTTEICSSKQLDLGSIQWCALSLMSIIILIAYVYTSVRIRKKHHPGVLKLLRRRNFSAHVQFYSVIHCMTCLSAVTISACQVVRSMGFAVPLTLDYILFSSAAWGCMWGIIYFLQVLPWISIYAIAVHRMLRVFTGFILIFVIFLCAFALSFRRILLGTSGECPTYFDTLRETIYSSFLVMINSVDFRQYENVDKSSLYSLHVLFVFFMSVMLINFLIAIMTQSITYIFTNQEAIIQTQRLVLVMTAQMTLAWSMRAFYKIMHRRVFVYQNKRMCLRHTMIQEILEKPQNMFSWCFLGVSCFF